MGKSGSLKALIRGLGNTTANKTYKLYIGSTYVNYIGPVTTNPSWEVAVTTRNQGSEALQSNSRQTALTGIGASGATFVAAESTAVDTTVDQNISISMQISSTSACAILLHADVTATYGD